MPTDEELELAEDERDTANAANRALRARVAELEVAGRSLIQELDDCDAFGEDAHPNLAPYRKVFGSSPSPSDTKETP